MPPRELGALGIPAENVFAHAYLSFDTQLPLQRPQRTNVARWTDRVRPTSSVPRRSADGVSKCGDHGAEHGRWQINGFLYPLGAVSPPTTQIAVFSRQPSEPSIGLVQLVDASPPTTTAIPATADANVFGADECYSERPSASIVGVTHGHQLRTVPVQSPASRLRRPSPSSRVCPRRGLRRQVAAATAAASVGAAVKMGWRALLSICMHVRDSPTG
jgi:hypothetical protein